MTSLTLKQFHVKSWQLIPHDSFEWALSRRIQVGDSVRVVSRLSSDYKEGGRVCNVTELGVEVIGDRLNTKVHGHDNLLIYADVPVALVHGTTLVFREGSTCRPIGRPVDAGAPFSCSL